MLLFLHISFQIYIKHLNEDLYLCDDNMNITACNKKYATDWSIQIRPDGVYTVISPSSDLIWNLDFNKMLILDSQIKRNISFKVDNGKQIIKHKNLCLKYNKKKARYYFESCKFGMEYYKLVNNIIVDEYSSGVEEYSSGVECYGKECYDDNSVYADSHVEDSHYAHEENRNYEFRHPHKANKEFHYDPELYHH